jgi:hypothetical protein
MFNEDGCDEVIAAFNGACGSIECVLDLFYCTAKVDKAKEQGYACFGDFPEVCGPRGLPRRSWAPSCHPGRPPSRPIRIQATGCVTTKCGRAPDGKEQGYMIDPVNCDQTTVPCSNVAECYNYLFCAEELEIQKTLFTTAYECAEDVNGIFISPNITVEVCEDEERNKNSE